MPLYSSYSSEKRLENTMLEVGRKAEDNQRKLCSVVYPARRGRTGLGQEPQSHCFHTLYPLAAYLSSICGDLLLCTFACLLPPLSLSLGLRDRRTRGARFMKASEGNLAQMLGICFVALLGLFPATRSLASASSVSPIASVSLCYASPTDTDQAKVPLPS